MKFLDKINEDEFFNSLEKGIERNASFEKNLADERTTNAVMHLTNAIDLLERAGLHKAAQHVAVIKKVVNEDKQPEHYLNNLLQTGIMQDLTCTDDHNSDTCSANDCPTCQKGEEPQLSQEELKALRGLLKTEKSEHEATEDDQESDENDVKAIMNTPSGDVAIEMTPQETKQVLSKNDILTHLKKLL